jgi:hypothetical protein
MDSITDTGSLVIASDPETLYDMVADVTRMGQWSPVCKACWWDEGQGPEVGSWFTGRNESDGATWETRSQVVVAERGREFAFMVGGSWIRWGYTFTPVADGTEVTESWDFTPVGITLFHEWFGDRAESEIAGRVEAARTGIPATLAALKRAAEAEAG